jgi:hypothetical protein
MFSKPLISANMMLALLLNLSALPALNAASATPVRIPVHWVLTPGAEPNCSQLNQGITSVTGDGEQHFVVKVITNANGSKTMMVESVAHGAAVDNNGNRYSWAYINHLAFALNNNEGHFTDRFNLVSLGNAPNIKVYLSWDVIIDPNHDPQELPFFSTFISGTSKGSPFCDPI